VQIPNLIKGEINMAKKKTMACECHDHAKAKLTMGIGLLIVSGMLYLGYGWMEIFGVLGILAILKGLWMMKK